MQYTIRIDICNEDISLAAVLNDLSTEQYLFNDEQGAVLSGDLMGGNPTDKPDNDVAYTYDISY